jgi:hypothetical protein
MADKITPIGSGIDYPTLTLSDGVTYTVRFTRASVYRLDKAGFDVRKLGSEIQAWFPKDLGNGLVQNGNLRFSVLVDVLHASITPQYTGTTDDLAELLDLPYVQPAALAVINALAKTWPSAQKPVETTAPISGTSVQ